MSVTESVVTCISGTVRPNFSKFSVHVACGRGSVLWRRCNMLCTSGSVNDVMFPVTGRTAA